MSVASCKRTFDAYDISIQPDWEIIEICKNVFIIETSYLRECTAYIEQHAPSKKNKSRKSSFGLLTIFVKRNQSDADKAISVFHELVHIPQLCRDDIAKKNLTDDQLEEHDDKVAEEMEYVFAAILKYYRPFLPGLIDLSRKLRSGIHINE